MAVPAPTAPSPVDVAENRSYFTYIESYGHYHDGGWVRERLGGTLGICAQAVCWH